MISNSTLTKFQKELRKQDLNMVTEFGGGVLTSDSGNTTIAFVPEFKGSRMLQVAFAICNPNEIKARRKVGEYKALERLANGEYVLLPDGFDPYTLVEAIEGNVMFMGPYSE